METMVCVALCRCGKARMMSVIEDDGTYSDECQKELKRLVKWPYEIKHVTIQEARQLVLSFHQYGYCDK